MSVSLRDARSAPDDRRWLEGIYRDYLDDLSATETRGGAGSVLFPALAEVGHTGSDQVARWFADRSAHVLLILSNGQPVGFAMVARGAVQPPASVDYRMAEFFVARPHRRRGVGRSAVPLILDRFNGRWEIREALRNTGAVDFWRRTVARYTGGRYRERVHNGEVCQTFVSGPARPAPVTPRTTAVR